MKTALTKLNLDEISEAIAADPSLLSNISIKDERARTLFVLLAKRYTEREAQAEQLEKETEKYLSDIQKLQNLIAEKDEIIEDMLSLLRQGSESSS